MSKTLLVTGDTHGSIRTLYPLIDRLSGERNLDLIIHLGDFVEDAEELASIFSDLSLVMVAGNNDWMRKDIARKKVLQLEGHGLLLLHGNGYLGESGAKKMRGLAKKKDCDIVLFGHTHRFFLEEKEGIFRINPGSPTRPRGDGIPSAVLLTLQKDFSPEVERLETDRF